VFLANRVFEQPGEIAMTIARHVRHASLALLALSSIGVLPGAYAAGTDAGVSINNRATVNYSVLSVAQTPIESSPTGNSNPGVGNGAPTTFVVDNKILHTVAEVGTSATLTTPGALNVVTTFTVTNTGNNSQGYQLTATNLTGGSLFSATDNTDVTNLRVFRDSNGNNAYDAGVDNQAFIDTLAEDATVTVFVVADVPVTASNNQFANVQLAARAAVAGTNGATLVTESTGADNPATVDVVFADAGAVARDGLHEAADQYAIRSASLSVSKTALVVSDPFNNTSNPKAIPGAIVRYTVTVTNASTTTAAQSVVLDDQIPANTAFVAGSLTLNAGTLTDGNDADAGRYEATPTPRIVVNAGTVNASGGTATVTFDVTIQ
jgi:uncharacterized repeat protein (TIGR01451 family)